MKLLVPKLYSGVLALATKPTIRTSTRLGTMPPKRASESSPSGILMVLSPAKTLNLDAYQGSLSLPSSDYCDPDKTQRIAQILQAQTRAGLKKTLGISDKLTTTVADYWKQFSWPHPKDDGKPCIYAFSGAAFQGLEVDTLKDEQVLYLQDHLRILDAVYGTLRPHDLIQAYRLEMNTRLAEKEIGTKKLSDFWKPAITERLARDLSTQIQGKVLLNLASDEYFSAIDTQELRKVHDVVTVKCVFQVNGRVVAVHAKRARGLMVRHLAQIQASTLDDVRSFDLEGYAYDESKSTETDLVFNRTDNGGSKRGSTAKATAKSSKRSKK